MRIKFSSMSKSLRLGKLESFERVSNVGSKANWLGRFIPNKSSRLFQHYSVYCIEYSEMVYHQPPPPRCQIQSLMYHYTFDEPSCCTVYSKWTAGSYCSFYHK